MLATCNPVPLTWAPSGLSADFSANSESSGYPMSDLSQAGTIAPGLPGQFVQFTQSAEPHGSPIATAFEEFA